MLFDMGSPSLLLISDHPEDLQTITFVAQTHSLRVVRAQTSDAIAHALLQDSIAIVFWNSDDEKLGPSQLQTLQTAKVPSRAVFAIGDKELSSDSPAGILLRSWGTQGIAPPFSHFVFRRFADPAPFLISRLVSFSLQAALPNPAQKGAGPALVRFFADGSWNQKINLARSNHKKAAVAALEKVLTEKKVPKRLATLVASAADELLLNAIYEAPVAKGNQPGAKELRYQRIFDRNKDLELNDREKVALILAASPSHLGVMVEDQWGSIPSESLQKLFWSTGTEPTGAGKLGLASVAGSGMSLQIHSVPGVSTEVSLLIPMCETFKDFRSGFRFTSVVIH